MKWLIPIAVIVLLMHIACFVFGVDNNPKTKWFCIDWNKGG